MNLENELQKLRLVFPEKVLIGTGYPLIQI